MNYQTCLLTTTVFPHEAHVIASYLDSEGIECEIKDEFTTQMDNFLSNAIGGVKIMVDPGNYEKGLEALRKGGYLQEEQVEANPIEKVKRLATTKKDECPFCQSKNIAKNHNLNMLSVAFYFVLGALLPIFKSAYVCFDCEKKWRFVG